MDKQAEEREKIRRELLTEAVKEIMATKHGRLFVYEQLEACGVYHSSAGKACFKTNETFFYEGQRNAGLRLQSQIIELAPGGYSTMLQENSEDSNDEL